VARLGARPVPTCEVPVLFAAELATGLFGHFLAAISGGNLYRHSSFLEGALGQRLFPAWLNLDERPHIPRAMGSATFDGDGLATYAKPFVAGGELVFTMSAKPNKTWATRPQDRPTSMTGYR
jgi:PmbA protein